jgi:hypothetical protein
MWEWAAYFAAGSGKTGLDRSTYQRRHLGITFMLGRWLRDAGCGAPSETPYTYRTMGAREIHQTAYAIDLSAGQPAHESFLRQARRFAHQVRSLLLRTGVIEEREHATLCSQLDGELISPEFCGLFYLLRAWAPRT